MLVGSCLASYMNPNPLFSRYFVGRFTVVQSVLSRSSRLE